MLPPSSLYLFNTLDFSSFCVLTILVVDVGLRQVFFTDVVPYAHCRSISHAKVGKVQSGNYRSTVSNSNKNRRHCLQNTIVSKHQSLPVGRSKKTDGVEYKNDCQRCDRQKTRAAGFHCLRPLSSVLTVRQNSV